MFCYACKYYDNVMMTCHNIGGLGSIDFPYVNPVEFCSLFEIKNEITKNDLERLFPQGIIDFCDFAPWMSCENCVYYRSHEGDDFGKCKTPQGLHRGAFKTSYCSYFEPKKGLIE